jgi:propanol-preferring alcohol dehydrogenase
MKAARFYKVGDPLKIEEIEIPTIENNEVLIRIRSCGVCHTDIHFALEGLMKPGKVPLTLGHEPSGDIVDVGKNVKDFRKGDRVLVHFYFNCNHCTFCIAGRESLCDNLKTFGFNVDGGYAEYAKAPASRVVKILENVPYDAGVLVDSGATAFHAVRAVGNVQKGEYVLVVGAGGVGSSLIQLAKLFGAKVIAVDISDDKLSFASELGASKIVNVTKFNAIEEITNFTDGHGIDVAFETVSSKDTLQYSFNSVRKGGKFVLIGYQPGVDFIEHPTKILLNEKQVLGSRASSLSELKEVVSLVASGKLKLSVTRRFRLDQVNEALAALSRGEIQGRAVIEP